MGLLSFITQWRTNSRIKSLESQIQVRPTPQLYLQLADAHKETGNSQNAAKVQLIETTSGEYYGKGYQDVQNRVPKIENTMKDLGWAPQVRMQDALKGIFDAYRAEMQAARDLV